MQCSICGLSLEANSDNGVEWNRHNAQPINDGTCCTDCNDNLVTPQRLADRHRGHNPDISDFLGEEQHNDDD